MIGWDVGAPAGGSDAMINIGAIAQRWDRLTDTADELTTRLTAPLEPVWNLVSQVVETAIWVLETVAEIYPLAWEQWITHRDERVCPECGPLEGERWEAGDGPYPPLHTNCRCARAVAFTEWRTRWVEQWRLERTRTVSWEWSITGWA